MFNKILRNLGIFIIISTSTTLASCSPIIVKSQKEDKKLINPILESSTQESEEDLDNKESESQVTTKRNVTSDSLSSNSVWFDTWNIWSRIKNWWNSWGEPLFIGIFWLSGVAGIGVAAYNIHLNNKRDFKLKDGQQLKVTLDFQPESDVTGGSWYGRFYNDGGSLESCCSCQRKFKSKNSNNSENSTSSYPVTNSFILVNGPSKPGVMLYNLEGSDDKSSNGKEKYWTNIITFKDYYPGSNTIDVYGYQGSTTSVRKKLGKLTVVRELIECKEKDECSCCKEESECCKKENLKKCKCICECKNDTTCQNNQTQMQQNSCCCEIKCCKQTVDSMQSSYNCDCKNKDVGMQQVNCCCIIKEKKKCPPSK